MAATIDTSDEHPELPPSARSRGQRSALLANLFGNVITYVAQGPILMLFANDVLDLTASRIGSVLAVIPLAALLRIPFLRVLESFGKVRTLVIGDAARIAALLALMLVPSEALTFGLFLTILLLSATATQISVGAVWQPLLRDITTVEDRGQFFARMRFFFTIISTGFTGIVPLIIGETITEGQFKILLGIAVLGLVNHAIWATRIPEVKADAGSQGGASGARPPRSGVRDIVRVIRTSPLLRTPALVFVLFQFGQLAAFPLFSVYLRQVLLIPSNITSLYFFAVTLGQAVSLLLWGRIVDTIGFRPFLIGLIFVSIVSTPLVLLLPESLGAGGFLVMGTLVFFGTVSGAVQSGTKLAVTSIEHYHASRRDSILELNLSAGLRVLTISGKSLLLGFFIEELAVPAGSTWVAEPILSVDLVKGYMLVIGVALQVTAILVARRLPNIRPHFGVGDFFSSLTVGSIRSILVERQRFRGNESQRLEAARMLASQAGPLAVDQLIELLDDPSYDVKVMATRGLAQVRSRVAEDKLLGLLDDPELSALHDQVAWALGELRSLRAVETLLGCLAPDHADSVRSMAARALGKIGDHRAVEPLTDLARDPELSQRLQAAACVALIELDHAHSASVILSVLARLTDRAERYEVMNALCQFLEISNEWLLRYLPGSGPRAALLEYGLRQSPSWQRERRQTLEALRERDVDGIREAFLHRLAELSEAPVPTLAAMRDTLEQATRWQPVLVLAAAWLLLS